jgi:hypothetical protein
LNIKSSETSPGFGDDLAPGVAPPPVNLMAHAAGSEDGLKPEDSLMVKLLVWAAASVLPTLLIWPSWWANLRARQAPIRC